MKIYHGQRSANGCTVSVDGTPLDPRTDLRQISTTGFEWGYMGSGQDNSPGTQTAVAILADHFGDAAKAIGQYKRDFSAIACRLDRIADRPEAVAWTTEQRRRSGMLIDPPKGRSQPSWQRRMASR